MPESVQEQTISKQYGSPIPDSALPLDYDRRIVMDSTGCCSIAFFEKHSKEVLDYFVDAMKWLEPRELIIGASAWCEPETLVATRVEYASTGVVVWLAGGGDNERQTVNVQVSTSLGKIKLVQFVVQTIGVSSVLTLVTVDDDAVTVGPNEDPEPNPALEPILNAYPSSIKFPITAAVSGESTATIVLKNDGTDTAHINSIQIAQPFFQTNNGTQRLAPGEFTQLTIKYKPQDIAKHTGSLKVDIGKGLKSLVTLKGVSESANRVTTVGNQFVLTGGVPFRIKAVNWFGAESEDYAPHGLLSRSYKDVIDQIKSMGFNAVRLPFSGDICNNDRTPSTGVINESLNPDLVGLNSIQVLDALITYMNDVGLYIILDHHRRHAGDGADGYPVDETYTLAQWKASWLFMVARYKHLDFMLGADLHNEPHLMEWGAWADLAENAGNAILAAAPHWLIFVEGVATHGDNSYWRGGELSGVADRPIQLSVAGRLAYSVHEYGISVGEQTWLAKDNAVPAQWPLNLYSVWRQHWGFIFEQNIAPIWIGEVGGKFGVDGSGNVVSDSNAQYERQWIYHLQRYMDGYYDGSTIRQLDSDDQGISFAYWSLNPTSSDTGGILQDDWTTEQSTKLELIGMMLNNMALPLVLGLSPLDYSDVDDSSQIIINQDGVDHAINFTALKDAMRMRIYEVGEVHFFNQNVDVAARYAGQVWARIPSEDKVIRIAKLDGSNIGVTGGSNNVTIAKDNLPNVQINVTGTISSTDLGTKATASSGSHSHGINIYGSLGNIDVSSADNQGFSGDTGVGSSVGSTNQAGAHTHDITLGSHGHDLTDAKTAALGSGTQLNVTNEYITLAAWFRVS